MVGGGGGDTWELSTITVVPKQLNWHKLKTKTAIKGSNKGGGPQLPTPQGRIWKHPGSSYMPEQLR